MSVFEYLDYKKYLKNHIQHRPRGEVGMLAKAAECQQSYLSQVLTSQVQLTTEQAFLLSKHLGHSSLEADYFKTLLELQRSSKKSYKDFLKKKLETLKSESEAPPAKNHSEERNDLINQEYYSTWMFQAIHIMTSIPSLQTSEAMAKNLGITVESVEGILQRLESFGYVKKTSHLWTFLSGQNALSPGSPFLYQLHNQWRTQASMNTLAQKESDLHFTVIQTLSERDFLVFRQELISLVGRFESMSNRSAAEQLINFNFDFYKVAR